MDYSLFARIDLLIVGSVFLLTGLAKVLEPWAFIRHLTSLRLVQPRWVRSLSPVFIGFEIALGVALILAVFPRVLIPLCLLVIIGLSVLTFWSTSTGRTEDCGCYNGWLQISPAFSLGLNAIYCIMLVGAWNFLPDTPTAWWQWLLPIVALIVGSALASRHLDYVKANHRPYVELAPRLKVDAPWQSAWLENAIDVSAGSWIVVFLGTGCPLCKHWLPVLKVVHHRADLPDVVGVVSTPTVEAARDYAESFSLNFPTVAIDRHPFGRLALILPTAVLLEDGIIREKWIGSIPEEFINEIAAGPMVVPDGDGLVLTTGKLRGK